MIFSPTTTPAGTWVLFRTKDAAPITGEMTIKKWHGDGKLFTEISECPFMKYMDPEMWNQTVDILEIKLSMWTRIKRFLRK